MSQQTDVITSVPSQLTVGTHREVAKKTTEHHNRHLWRGGLLLGFLLLVFNLAHVAYKQEIPPAAPLGTFLAPTGPCQYIVVLVGDSTIRHLAKAMTFSTVETWGYQNADAGSGNTSVPLFAQRKYLLRPEELIPPRCLRFNFQSSPARYSNVDYFKIVSGMSAGTWPGHDRVVFVLGGGIWPLLTYDTPPSAVEADIVKGVKRIRSDVPGAMIYIYPPHRAWQPRKLFLEYQSFRLSACRSFRRQYWQRTAWHCAARRLAADKRVVMLDMFDLTSTDFGMDTVDAPGFHYKPAMMNVMYTALVRQVHRDLKLPDPTGLLNSLELLCTRTNTVRAGGILTVEDPVAAWGRNISTPPYYPSTAIDSLAIPDDEQRLRWASPASMPKNQCPASYDHSRVHSPACAPLREGIRARDVQRTDAFRAPDLLFDGGCSRDVFLIQAFRELGTKVNSSNWLRLARVDVGLNSIVASMLQSAIGGNETTLKEYMMRRPRPSRKAGHRRG